MSDESRRLSDVDVTELLAGRRHDHLLLLDRPMNGRRTKLHLPVDAYDSGDTPECGGATKPDDPSYRRVRPEELVRDLELCQVCDPAVMVSRTPSDHDVRNQLVEMDVEEFDAIVEFKRLTQGGGSA